MLVTLRAAPCTAAAMLVPCILQVPVRQASIFHLNLLVLRSVVQSSKFDVCSEQTGNKKFYFGFILNGMALHKTFEMIKIGVDFLHIKFTKQNRILHFSLLKAILHD